MMKIWIKRFVQLSLVAATSLAIIACASDEEELCDWACDCDRDVCSDRRYDDCVYDAEREWDRAERRGCDDLLDDWRACVLDDARCDAGSVCRRELEDYAWCMR